MNTIRDHLNEVRENIQKACEKAGRSPQEVTLIAVSKTKPLFMLKKRMRPAHGISVKIRYRRFWKNTRKCLRMPVSI